MSDNNLLCDITERHLRKMFKITINSGQLQKNNKIWSTKTIINHVGSTKPLLTLLCNGKFSLQFLRYFRFLWPPK